MSRCVFSLIVGCIQHHLTLYHAFRPRFGFYSITPSCLLFPSIDLNKWQWHYRLFDDGVDPMIFKLNKEFFLRLITCITIFLEAEKIPDFCFCDSDLNDNLNPCKSWNYFIQVWWMRQGKRKEWCYPLILYQKGGRGGLIIHLKVWASYLGGVQRWNLIENAISFMITWSALCKNLTYSFCNGYLLYKIMEDINDLIKQHSIEVKLKGLRII